MDRLPLGKATDFPQEYAPDVLCSVARAGPRAELGLEDELPFSGVDLWNAWEFSWLDVRGQPRVGVVSLRFDAGSPDIVESKSLKLYLGSFAMTRVGGDAELVQMLSTDLERASGAPVSVSISKGANANHCEVGTLPGENVDDLPMANWSTSVDPDLLVSGGETVTATLNSHLLRSLCPVTAQPDTGSVMLHYRGPRIEPVSFLEYVVSFRQKQAFHEACIERIFVDLKARCRPEELTVYARYNRRGGIDINPFRSDFEEAPPNFRLWRQ